MRLEVPGGYGRSATHMQVEADVVVRYSAAAEIIRQRGAGRANTPLPRWRVPPHQLGELISSLLATLTFRDVVAPLADLSGIDPLAVPQPRVMHMVTGGPVTDVLDTTGLRLIPEAGYSGGAHLLGDPALDLADDDDRREQVRRWLIQIALDGGLTGMEKLLGSHPGGSLFTRGAGSRAQSKHHLAQPGRALPGHRYGGRGAV